MEMSSEFNTSDYYDIPTVPQFCCLSKIAPDLNESVGDGFFETSSEISSKLHDGTVKEVTITGNNSLADMVSTCENVYEGTVMNGASKVPIGDPDPSGVSIVGKGNDCTEMEIDALSSAIPLLSVANGTNDENHRVNSKTGKSTEDPEIQISVYFTHLGQVLHLLFLYSYPVQLLVHVVKSFPKGTTVVVKQEEHQNELKRSENIQTCKDIKERASRDRTRRSNTSGAAMNRGAPVRIERVPSISRHLKVLPNEQEFHKDLARRESSMGVNRRGPSSTPKDRQKLMQMAVNNGNFYYILHSLFFVCFYTGSDHKGSENLINNICSVKIPNGTRSSAGGSASRPQIFPNSGSTVRSAQPLPLPGSVPRSSVIRDPSNTRKSDGTPSHGFRSELRRYPIPSVNLVFERIHTCKYDLKYLSFLSCISLLLGHDPAISPMYYDTIIPVKASSLFVLISEHLITIKLFVLFRTVPNVFTHGLSVSKMRSRSTSAVRGVSCLSGTKTFFLITYHIVITLSLV
uniref:Pecanex-like protein n=1 Tax=Heterorhabditis bacteriophora TaxID=37862 RepID=A0A1I7XN69_HETBA